MSNSFAHARDELLTALSDLREMAQACDRLKHLESLRSDLEDLTLKVGVTGGESAGKSSLINAIIGRPGYLPTSQLTTTTCIIEVRVGHQATKMESLEFKLASASEWQEKITRKCQEVYVKSRSGRKQPRGIGSAGLLGSSSYIGGRRDCTHDQAVEEFELFCARGSTAIDAWHRQQQRVTIRLEPFEDGDSRWPLITSGLVPWKIPDVQGYLAENSPDELPPLPPECIGEMTLHLRSTAGAPPLTLVDMPGFGGVEDSLSAVAHQALAATDVHLLLFPSVNSSLSKVEAEKYKEFLDGHYAERCIFVATKMDLVDRDIRDHHDALLYNKVCVIDKEAEDRFVMVSARWQELALTKNDVNHREIDSSAFEWVWEEIAHESGVSYESALQDPDSHAALIRAVLVRCSGIETLVEMISTLSQETGHLVRSITTAREKVSRFRTELAQAIESQLSEAIQAKSSLDGSAREWQQHLSEANRQHNETEALLLRCSAELEAGVSRITSETRVREASMVRSLLEVGMSTFDVVKGSPAAREEAMRRALVDAFTEQHKVECMRVEGQLEELRGLLAATSWGTNNHDGKRKVHRADLDGKLAMHVVERRPPILEIRNVVVESPEPWYKRWKWNLSASEEGSLRDHASYALAGSVEKLARQSGSALDLAVHGFEEDASGVISRLLAANEAFRRDVTLRSNDRHSDGEMAAQRLQLGSKIRHLKRLAGTL